MKYKAGEYVFERTPDLFEWKKKPKAAQIIETKLTESEANNLISNKLYEKLGFSGWSFVGE
jgi:hypothetical protein